MNTASAIVASRNGRIGSLAVIVIPNSVVSTPPTTTSQIVPAQPMTASAKDSSRISRRMLSG